jgi:hypothetical protein
VNVPNQFATTHPTGNTTKLHPFVQEDKAWAFALRSKATKNNPVNDTFAILPQATEPTTYGPFGMFGGKQITITQKAAAWQANISEQYGAETLTQTLPVCCKGNIPKILTRLHGKPSSCTKHLLHLVPGPEAPLLFVGELGVRGGGAEQSNAGTGFSPYKVAVDPDSDSESPIGEPLEETVRSAWKVCYFKSTEGYWGAEVRYGDLHDNIVYKEAKVWLRSDFPLSLSVNALNECRKATGYTYHGNQVTEMQYIKVTSTSSEINSARTARREARYQRRQARIAREQQKEKYRLEAIRIRQEREKKEKEEVVKRETTEVALGLLRTAEEENQEAQYAFARVVKETDALLKATNHNYAAFMDRDDPEGSLERIMQQRAALREQQEAIREAYHEAGTALERLQRTLQRVEGLTNEFGLDSPVLLRKIRSNKESCQANKQANQAKWEGKNKETRTAIKELNTRHQRTTRLVRLKQLAPTIEALREDPAWLNSPTHNDDKKIEVLTAEYLQTREALRQTGQALDAMGNEQANGGLDIAAFDAQEALFGEQQAALQRVEQALKEAGESRAAEERTKREQAKKIAQEIAKQLRAERKEARRRERAREVHDRYIEELAFAAQEALDRQQEKRRRNIARRRQERNTMNEAKRQREAKNEALWAKQRILRQKRVRLSERNSPTPTATALA